MMIEYYYSINGSWELNTPIKDYFSDRWDTITLTRRELTLVRQILRHTNNRLEGLLYLHDKMWDMQRIDGNSYERLTKALIDNEFYVEHEREITQEELKALYGGNNDERRRT